MSKPFHCCVVPNCSRNSTHQIEDLQWLCCEHYDAVKGNGDITRELRELRTIASVALSTLNTLLVEDEYLSNEGKLYINNQMSPIKELLEEFDYD